MKHILSLLALVIFLGTQAQESTTFILVRHAEKAADDPRDPNLSEEGQQRAVALMNLLERSELTAIYSTPYKRTRNTVAPLAKKLNIEITDYSPSDPKGLMSSLLEKHKGGTVLISGHSNTTPFLANVLLGEQKYEQYDDSDYGNILIITVLASGKAGVIHLRY